MLTHARHRELTRKFHAILRNRLPTIDLLWRFFANLVKRKREHYLHVRSNQSIAKIVNKTMPYLVSLAAGFLIPDKNESQHTGRSAG